MVKVEVDLPGRFSGELELEPITVVIGRPRSGKTTLLRLICNALYMSLVGKVPRDLKQLLRTVEFRDVLRPISLSEGEGEMVVECSKEDDISCTSIGGIANGRVLFIPTEVELIIKFGYTPPFEPYMEFGNLINKLRAGMVEAERTCYNEYGDVIRSDEVRLVARGGELYEVVGDREVEVMYSSTAVAKLNVLERALYWGLLDEYDYILMDNPEAGLHPHSMAKLALLIHALGSCGKRIIVATHDLIFIDMLRHVDQLNRMLKANVRPVDIALYVIEGTTIRRYDTTASYIRDYTEYIYIVYGYEPLYQDEETAIFRKL